MGFTISGSDTVLSSGHPGPGEQVPDPLGLVESRDRGETWTTLSLGGQVDFHALEVTADTVYGYDATHGVLAASIDGGRTWESRAALDIAADPRAPAVVLATVRGGVAASRDGGSTFAAPTGPQLAYLSRSPAGPVYGISLDGAMFASTDSATSWQQVGVVPGRPQAVTATGSALLAATGAGSTAPTTVAARSPRSAELRPTAGSIPDQWAMRGSRSTNRRPTAGQERGR